MDHYFPNEDNSQQFFQESQHAFRVPVDDFFNPKPPLSYPFQQINPKQSLHSNSKNYQEQLQQDNYPNSNSKTSIGGRSSEFSPQKEENIFYQEEEEKVDQKYQKDNSFQFQGQKLPEQEIQEENNDGNLNNKTIKGKNKKIKKSPVSKTRNMLQFFWKVLKNYFLSKVDKSDIESYLLQTEKGRAWKEIMHLTPSIASFTVMFNKTQMRKHLRGLFRSGYLVREIISSGIDIGLKKVYIRYIKVLRKAFAQRRLHFLN